ncbi:hypothetical protein BCR44DRAFT_43658, partial [Catenaria anguillulae PL171]
MVDNRRRQSRASTGLAPQQAVSCSCTLTRRSMPPLSSETLLRTRRFLARLSTSALHRPSWRTDSNAILQLCIFVSEHQKLRC